MTPPNRVNAGKARGSVATWLRQKFGKVKAAKRDTLKTPAHVKPKNWGANRGNSHGSPPKADALKDWRQLMWSMKLMPTQNPKYKKLMADAAKAFDRLMLRESENHRGRHHGTVATTKRQSA